MKSTTKKVKFGHEELKQELAKGEAQMTMLGHAYDDIEQDFEHLNSQRGNTTSDMAQVVALQKTIK